MPADMVAALILADRRLLLVHNIKYSLRIEPPGGKVEAGESPSAALSRECREELGLSISVGQLFGTYETQTPEGPFACKMYWCSTAGTPVLNEPKKISSFGWYTYPEIRAFEKSGTLAPNLSAALPALVSYLRQ